MSDSNLGEEIRQSGFVVDKVVAGRVAEGNAVLEVHAEGGGGGSGGGKALLLAFSVAGLQHRLPEWLDELLLFSSLCHPHLATLHAIFRTATSVCLRLQHCNGGCVFEVVARGRGGGGRGGLPLAAAVFLVQQAVLAVEFLHLSEKFLHPLSPQALRVDWNAQSVPILKVIAVPFPPMAPRRGRPSSHSSSHEAGAARAVASMWTAPHLIRADPTRDDSSARFRCACDVWALAVVAYFTLFGAWPFTKQQIAQWGSTAVEVWEADKAVQFTGPDEPQPEAEQEAALLRFLQEVFAAGHLSAAAFAEQLGDLTCITQAAWFRQGLPEGAGSMTATYCEKTEERRASADFRTLAAEVQRVLAAMGGGSR